MAAELRLLYYLNQLEKLQYQETASGIIGLVHALVSELTRSSDESLRQIFYYGGGPSTIMQLFFSEVLSVRRCAFEAVTWLSNIFLTAYGPQKESIGMKIFLEFFRRTEGLCGGDTYDELIHCRAALLSQMLQHIMRFSLAATGQCDMFMGEFADSYLRQLHVIREVRNVSAERISTEIVAFVTFSESIRRLGFAAADKEIGELIKRADEWLELITKDQNAICGTIFLLLLLLYRLAQQNDGVKEKLSSLHTQRRAALDMLIQGYSRQGCTCPLPFSVMFCERSFLTFESRQILAMSSLPEPREEPHFVVRRTNVFLDSFKKVMNLNPQSLSRGISIEFAREESTGPGVLREWFSLVCKDMFSSKSGKFAACPAQKDRFFPCSILDGSHINLHSYLAYYRFCGRVIALAFMYKVRVHVKFATIFFKQLAMREITWEDVKDADHELHASCKKIMEMDAQAVDDLCLTFDIDVRIEDKVYNIDLCPKGKETAVDSNNRLMYLNMLVRRRFVEVTELQAKAFADGFSEVLQEGLTIYNFLDPLEHEDLDMIMFGQDLDICVLDWKEHTEYHGYTSSDKEIQWFWQAVEEMKNELRRKLLEFSTSIQHLPSEGFSGLPSKFIVNRAEGDLNRLPTAQTCFYQLNLPPYPSYKAMQNKLYTITGDHLVNGFGFG